ncbi:uracil permease [Propionigenium maris DSM 9537]|uniref:Uracil permease n=1 Tax=Propionigenium maris DSM 9537 TaxID=1123000 RepID=A0A9W6GJ25_9FUSO|nr:nucleobase:cation symporter-2 family protein [Propionigenium maris]GLI54666.1 uracil permease [Propionigenium maris DSM 9537]
MKNRSPYHLDGVPHLGEAVPLGLQHILAMFVSNITPIVIVAGVLGISSEDQRYLVQLTMFISGLNTLMQVYSLGTVGAKLPIVVGTNFAFVPVAITVGLKYGYEGVMGACLLGGFFEAFLGLYIKKLRKFFPPVVTGVVVLSIGLSLLPVGIQNMAGGLGSADYGSLSNFMVGATVIGVVVLFKHYGRGIWSTSAVIIGIAVGFILSIVLGKVDFTPMAQVGYFTLPKPLTYGFAFKIDAILAMALMYIVSAVETMGDMSSIAMGGAKREVTDRELSGGIIADGLGCVLASLFSILPTTSFSQNSGIIAMTGVMSRFVVGVGATILIICGFIPKIGALFSVIPASVVGGSLVMIFAMIVISGINLITKEPLAGKNSIIVSVSLGLGFGLGNVPEALAHFPETIQLIFGGSGIVVSGGIAVLLNQFLSVSKEKEAVLQEAQ